MKITKAFWTATAVALLGVGTFAGCTKKAEQAGSAETAAPKVSRVRMATGGNTGTYYAFGSALGQILGEKTGIPVIVQSTGASKANIQLIAGDEVEIAIVQNDTMDYAYKGTETFTASKDFTAVAVLYPEAIQVVATPGIKSIADLKGKNVSVGDVGSGTEINARQVLEAYGITYNDFNRQNLSFGASAEALKDGKIDAFFCVAGAPTPAIVDLAVGKDITVLEVDDGHFATLRQKYSFYTQYSIPTGSYRGVAGAVKTVAINATIIASNKLPEDTVYTLTKALFDNQPAIALAHVKGKELSLTTAVQGVPTPFHPGALKYYKEVGAIK
jgi:TRAP transporter TAXI family solute receptor